MSASVSQPQRRGQLPEEIWLAGKGPSLDTFDWSTAGAFRVGINEAALIVPDCSAAFAVDTAVLQLFKDVGIEIPVMRPHWAGKGMKFRLQFIGRQKQRNYTGSAPSAISLLAGLGVKTIHFVGFDAMNNTFGYAASILAKGWQGRNQDRFSKVNRNTQRAIEATGISPIWHF